ncbi:MAG: polymer-forming cytoskeletal protein [Chloroflexi bacterium]|nr:polymer-forming cytoskeletal protein [Chloroflexota bacterium]
MFKKDKPAALAGGKIDTVLGAGTSINGTLKSDGNLRIDGSYQGHIETAGNLIVGAAAKVLADIKANSVQVWGAVRGDITAQGRLEILPGGRVWGDIEVAALLIDEGGVYRGQCVMGGAQLEQTGLLEAGEDAVDATGTVVQAAGEEPASEADAQNGEQA